MLYRLLKILITIYLKIRYSLKVVKVEELKYEGPMLIASNHQTNWDPFTLYSVIPTRMAYMAKEELFQIPVFGWLMRREGVISVKRGAVDREAIRKALSDLGEGKILGIFPEGTRNKIGKEMRKFQPGLTMLAVRSGARVLPTWIEWKKNGKLEIWHGALLTPPSLQSSKEEQEQFTLQIREAIINLAEKAGG